MYFAILRNTLNKESPPGLLETECLERLREEISTYSDSGWECILLIEGKKMELSEMKITFKVNFSFLK